MKIKVFAATFLISLITIFLIVKYKSTIKPEKHKCYFGKEYFNVYDFKPKVDKIKNTFIILPSFSYFDVIEYMKNKKYVKYKPSEDFKPLIRELMKDNNRVVVIEYFGYNDSGETNRIRNSDNICEEIHKAISDLKIEKYILLPHSISGLYCLDYIRKYDDEIDGLVGIDITVPFEFLEEYNSNEEFLKHKFNDDGQKIPDSYKNMYSYFYETSEKLKYFSFSNNLPVILFTSTMLIDNIDNEIKKGILKTKIVDYFKNMITNDKIQKVNILEGTHFLHHTQSKKMAEAIKNMFN